MTGVFAISRNPIYPALMLVMAGISLALGETLLILLACVAPLYLHHLVRREEHFLAWRYGKIYASRRSNVLGWLGWPRP